MCKASQPQLPQPRDSGWDLAITEAECQISEAEKRIGKLRLSIESFNEFKKRGEPWPGDYEAMEKAAQRASSD